MCLWSIFRKSRLIDLFQYESILPCKRLLFSGQCDFVHPISCTSVHRRSNQTKDNVYNGAETWRWAKNVYTITLMYNTKLSVHKYSLNVMYTRFFFFSLILQNYKNNLIFFLSHCRPETLISAYLAYFPWFFTFSTCFF